VRNRTARQRFSVAGLCAAMLVVALGTVSCERGPSVVIENTNPPRFVFTGSGTVTNIRVTGPDLAREPNPQGGGEHLTALKVYWEIAASSGRVMSEIGPVTYGKVPTGFVQVQPQNGASPPHFVEKHLYNVRLSVNEGQGLNNFFVIRDGRIVSEADR